MIPPESEPHCRETEPEWGLDASTEKSPLKPSCIHLTYWLFGASSEPAPLQCAMLFSRQAFTSHCLKDLSHLRAIIPSHQRQVSGGCRAEIVTCHLTKTHILVSLRAISEPRFLSPATCDFSLRSRPPFTGVLRGPGLKVPHRVLFEQFWAPASECPKECFLSAFWPLWDTQRQVPKIAQKALRGALAGPGPGALL